ncbi:putative bifunctional diguanylate cyclase/phosphodiesterase [Henriciella marina]|uniref:putative bifunctional diguanylate cyclase/phosphodiesterase n=1 Tax=Henriciella marina TaxID=453851 RepID=UPI00035FD651|nr:GGDEF domain-containing phosphodiesterase [Henriciella marina]
MSNQGDSYGAKTSAAFWPSSWSLRTMDQARVHQYLVIFSAGAILLTVGFVIASMIAAGNYPLGVMAIVDAATALVLCLAIVLAFRRQAPTLQILLICICVPVNLVAEIMLQGAAAWIGLMLLGLSAFMWGLLAPVWVAILYTVGLIAFFNIYLSTNPEAAIIFYGRDETFLTAIALSIVAMASALAAILPRKITGAAYASLNKAARQETILKQRFAHYATLASDWHLEIDEHGTVTDFFGTGDAVGRHWRTILFDWEAQADTFHQALQTRTPYEKIRATLNLEGQSRRVECTGEPVFHEDGAFAGYRVIAHDITEKAEAEEKLKALALRDRLTGLGNRHAFNASIEAGQNRLSSEPTAVICVDLDNFKHINDRQGHEAGDIALCELGARFRGLEEDIPGLEVFRLGGDEFCALLQVRWDAEGGNRLAARFVDAISRPVEIDDRLIDLAASIGIASTSETTPLAGALERADAAVYEAKSLGGGRVVICDGDVETRLDRRLAIRRDLTQAITSSQIHFQYQPIFEVRSGKLSGVEALARWSHPDYGNISPDEFISIAESSRTIIALGQYTLRRACTETLQWMKTNGRPLRLNVNVSPAEIMSDGFVGSLFDILEETRFPPDLLELEITERGILEDMNASRDQLNSIRARGVTVSLDDFGTGHSSLSRLESLPVDRIKIDRSFFAQAAQSSRAQKLVALMSRMGDVLDVDIVAEGIETEEQLTLVRLAGFAKVQGYLLGRPASLEDLVIPEGDEGIAPLKNIA